MSPTRLGIVLAATIGLVQSQTIAPQATPKFEVASIKPSTDCEGHPYGRWPDAPSPGRLSACVSLEDYINFAYIVFADGQAGRPHRRFPGPPPIEGGPSWMDADLYEIDAKAAGGASMAVMAGPMLQALLEDRFKLKLRHTSRESAVYALTEGKNGHKLPQFKEGTCIPFDMVMQPLAPGQRRCYDHIGSKGQNVTLDAQGIDLDYFCRLLTSVLDRPAVDKTGIRGMFNVHLEFARNGMRPLSVGGDLAQPVGEVSDALGPSIFGAVEQLGLKLDAAKGPRQFLVIDHVERPTEN